MVDLNKMNEFILTLYRTSPKLSVAEFSPWALDAFKEVLAFDSAIWGHTTDTDIIPYNIYLYHQPDEIFHSYSQVQKYDPLPGKLLTVKPGTTINFDWIIPKVEFNKHPLYLKHAKKFGMEYTLSTRMVDPLTTLNVFIAVYRANAKQPFTNEECQVMEFLLPHLVEAHNQNILHQLREKNTHEKSSNMTHALCDQNGEIHFTEPQFVEHMRKEWKDWAGSKIMPDLSSLFDAPHEKRVFKGRSIVVKIYQSNDLFHLIAHEKNILDSLSIRENTIAKMISMGLSYKEVAKQLGVSLSTITTHMNNIYKKLGLRNKAELSYCMDKGNT